MVYQKYIKRGRKLHGPYYYESYRDESGKIKKRYLGTDLEFNENTVKPGLNYLFIIVLFLLIAVLFFSLQMFSDRAGYFYSFPDFFSNQISLSPVCGDGLCEYAEDAVSCPDDCNFPFYGMSVERVYYSPGFSSWIVNTTGAMYKINETTVEMWRRIDPATNGENPRRVAELIFEKPIGGISISEFSNRSVILTSSSINLTVYSDSMFLVSSFENISYVHRNLIENASWKKGHGMNRIWTDGYGGSLHARFNGSVQVISEKNEETNFSIEPGAVMAHMAFPPKTFDFENFYGEDSKPFIYFAYYLNGSSGSLQDFMDNVGDYKEDGFGVVLLWSSFYNRSYQVSHLPFLLNTSTSPWILREGIYGYEYNNTDEIKNFVSFAHVNGFKVVTYFGAPGFDPDSGTFPSYPEINQSINDTLYFMQRFKEEYGLDGWYFDNAAINFGNLMDNYNFIKAVRSNLGDDGVIIHHESVDVLDNYPEYTGMKAVMVDVYVNYVLTGETGEMAFVDSPNEFYMRYFTSGYGVSQAYGSQIMPSNPMAAISWKEMNRVLAQNLYGWVYSVDRTYSTWIWYKHFYDLVKEQYLTGEIILDPYVDWEAKWFMIPQNVSVSYINNLTINISWSTENLSDSGIAYSLNGHWWSSEYPQFPSGPSGVVNSSQLVYFHSLVLQNLRPNTLYEFRIRSSNNGSFENETIWGFIGNFTTRENSTSNEESNSDDEDDEEEDDDDDGPPELPTSGDDDCIELWDCGNWGECVNGFRIKACVDIHHCGTTENKPNLREPCDEDTLVEEGNEENGGEMDLSSRFDLIFAGAIAILGTVGVVLGVVIYFLRERIVKKEMEQEVSW